MAANWHHLTVITDPDRTRSLVDTATRLGVRQLYLTTSRGVLRREKRGPFTLPSISPLFDVLHLLVPSDRLDAVVDGLVKSGDLERFGSGALWSSEVHDLQVVGPALIDATADLPTVETPADFEQNLVAIQCISQLDHAEGIAHAAIEAGSHSPSVCYGYGHGIRDRLGFFLQLTINPKKEFIDLVVRADEVEHIVGAMVEAGHLDQPAQGFLSTRPVSFGLINTVSYPNRSPYPASMDQIIRAIDQLQGNTQWRRSGTSGSRLSSRKVLKDLVTITAIVPRGLGSACSMAAMEAGAGGTSTFYANALPVVGPSDEREILSATVGASLVGPVTQAIASTPALAGQPLVTWTHPAPLAVTYIP